MAINNKFTENDDPIVPFHSLGFIWIFIFMATIVIGVQYFLEQDHNARKKEVKNHVQTVIQK